MTFGNGEDEKDSIDVADDMDNNGDEEEDVALQNASTLMLVSEK